VRALEEESAARYSAGHAGHAPAAPPGERLESASGWSDSYLHLSRLAPVRIATRARARTGGDGDDGGDGEGRRQAERARAREAGHGGVAADGGEDSPGRAATPAAAAQSPSPSPSPAPARAASAAAAAAPSPQPRAAPLREEDSLAAEFSPLRASASDSDGLRASASSAALAGGGGGGGGGGGASNSARAQLADDGGLKLDLGARKGRGGNGISGGGACGGARPASASSVGACGSLRQALSVRTLGSVAAVAQSARTAVSALQAHGAAVAQRDAALLGGTAAAGAAVPGAHPCAAAGAHAAAARARTHTPTRGAASAAGHAGHAGGLCASCAGGLSLATISQPTASAPGRYTSLGWRPQRAAAAATSWRAHAGAATCLALSLDDALLASGGADGVVRLWPTAALGVDVVHMATAARPLGGRQAVSALVGWGGASGGTSWLACGGKAGALEILDVQAGGALTSARTQAADGARVLALCTLDLFASGAAAGAAAAGGAAAGATAAGASGLAGATCQPLLVVADASGAVRALDLRAPPSQAEAWRLTLPPSHGSPTCLSAHAARQPCWLLVGSSRGRCALWDLRFAARTAEWAASGAEGVALTVLLPVAAARSSGAPTVLAGTGGNEVIGFEMGGAEPHARLCLRAHDAPARTEGAPAARAGAQHFPSARELGALAARHRVSALVAPPDGSVVVSAGTDGVVRCWDVDCAHKSLLVSAPTQEGKAYEFRARAPAPALGAGGGWRPPTLTIDEVEVAAPPRRPPYQRAAAERFAEASAHHASIHDCVFTSMPHGMLITAAADGTIKVLL
jgi:WD40 repeat protein